MTVSEIVNYRMVSQQLAIPEFKAPKDLVSWMGAIQSQDYGMSKWAIGIRIPGSTNETIESAINKGEIIRTHILRPTWHLVHACDIRWMLELTAPFIIKKAGTMYRQLELDEKLFKKSNAIIQKLLRNGNQLTREEIMNALTKKGIVTNDLRGAHLMFQAELDMIVCNGARRNNQFTYALLDEIVPSINKLNKEEALGELAKRYFISHGPATLQDFSWWSGLPVTQARTAMESIKGNLIAEKIDNKLYWFANGANFIKTDPDAIHFLPAYDEWIISYTDRTATLGPAFINNAILRNGIFKPVIVLNGKVCGLWKRATKNNKVVIEVQLLHSKKKIKKKKLISAADNFAKFTGKIPEIILNK